MSIMESPQYYRDHMSQDEDLFAGNMLADSAISDLDLSSQPYSPEVKGYRARGTRTAMKSLRSPPRQLANRAKPRDSLQLSKAWEEDAVDLNISEARDRPTEIHQDLAERIDNLTRTIQANAQYCVEASSRMLEIARENKHLYDAAGETLSTYVLQPCLTLGTALASHPAVNDGIQALKGQEAQLRNAVINYANSMGMARVGRLSSEDEAEVRRLKDRLVEQDALLQDSSQHMQRLMRERDLLRKQLEGEGSEEQGEVVEEMMGGHRESRSVKADEGEPTLTADQLRELRVLVEQLALHQASKREPGASKSSEPAPNPLGDEEEDEDGWALL